MRRALVVALALVSVAAVVVVRRGRCDTCNGWLCPVNVGGSAKPTD